MKEIRPPHENDQEKIQRAYDLIMDLMNNHPEIEPTLWCGAVWSALVVGYKVCRFSYAEFRDEIFKISRHYKSWWDDDK